MVSYLEKWKCPYCLTEYDKEDDAQWCAESCVPVDEPTLTRVIVCDMCGEDYETESDAVKCEDTHTRNDDKAHQNYLIKKNFEALDKAGHHPSQLKISDVK